MHKYIILISLCFLMGCSKYHPTPTHKQLVALRIVDQNGFSESIHSKDRLVPYQNIDFSKPQPYQKVLSVYGKNPDGSTPSYIISYYPNGQPRQYISAINNRAYGKYKEWYSNGHLKLEVSVIGGVADLGPSAEKTWIFDGMSYAFNEDGQLLAEIPYSKGDLEGISKYYHPCGALSQSIPCHKNKMEGNVTIYFRDGSIAENFHCIQNEKHGACDAFWNEHTVKSKETYEHGLLLEGSYFNQTGKLLCSVSQGSGSRAHFNDDGSYQVEEIINGVLEGCISIFSKNDLLIQQYHQKNNLKCGEELFFEVDPQQTTSRKKLSLFWVEGVIQGHARTWYCNGNLESQREISNNHKNGCSKAWYNDGNILLIEEYQKDVLVNGEYFKKGELFPVSRVINGKGIATIFNEHGIFLRKIIYNEGKPIT